MPSFRLGVTFESVSQSPCSPPRIASTCPFPPCTFARSRCHYRRRFTASSCAPAAALFACWRACALHWVQVAAANPPPLPAVPRRAVGSRRYYKCAFPLRNAIRTSVTAVNRGWSGWGGGGRVGQQRPAWPGPRALPGDGVVQAPAPTHGTGHTPAPSLMRGRSRRGEVAQQHGQPRRLHGDPDLGLHLGAGLQRQVKLGQQHGQHRLPARACKQTHTYEITHTHAHVSSRAHACGQRRATGRAPTPTQPCCHCLRQSTTVKATPTPNTSTTSPMHIPSSPAVQTCYRCTTVSPR